MKALGSNKKIKRSIENISSYKIHVLIGSNQFFSMFSTKCLKKNTFHNKILQVDFQNEHIFYRQAKLFQHKSKINYQNTGRIVIITEHKKKKKNLNPTSWVKDYENAFV